MQFTIALSQDHMYPGRCFGCFVIGIRAKFFADPYSPILIHVEYQEGSVFEALYMYSLHSVGVSDVTVSFPMNAWLMNGRGGVKKKEGGDHHMILNCCMLFPNN